MLAVGVKMRQRGKLTSRLPLVGMALSLSLAATPSRGELVRAGPEVRVNTHTASTYEDQADVTATTSGSFVVTWAEKGDSSGLGGAALSGVWGQLVSATGAPTGAPFLINDPTEGSKEDEPSIAALSGGGFVVVWHIWSTPTGSIRAQRFDDAANRLGDPIAVSDDVPTYDNSPAVASLGAGFVVVWTDRDAIYVRRFLGDGSPQGPSIRVDTFVPPGPSGFEVRDPHVAANAAGSFVAAWAEDRVFGQPDIVARRFGADGLPIGEPFVVGTKTEGFQVDPTVAVAADGSFLVTWSDGWDPPLAGNDMTVTGQFYDDGGAPMGSQLIINTNTWWRESGPRVAVDGAGIYTVVWHENLPELDRSDYGIVIRRYGPSGEPLSGAVAVNRFILGDQFFPHVAVNALGDALVVWLSEDELNATNVGSWTPPQHVHAQRMCDTDNPACDLCPGYDDSIDVDGDLEPDGCDSCVLLAPGQDPVSAKLKYKMGHYPLRPALLTANVRFTVPGGVGGLDPVTRGAKITVYSATGATMFEESIRPGAYDESAGVGWRVRPGGSGWSFVDLREPIEERHASVDIVDESAKKGPGSVKLKIKKRYQWLPFSQLLPPTLVIRLGDQADATQGRCAQHTYQLDKCRMSFPSAGFRCR